MDGLTGLLVPFFDPAALAAKVCALLQDLAKRQSLGAHARAFAQANYDLRAVCLPAQLEWVGALGSESASVNISTEPSHS